MISLLPISTLCTHQAIWHLDGGLITPYSDTNRRHGDPNNGTCVVFYL